MKKIVLAGAGYACISVLKSLPKSIFLKYDFILVNDNTFHYQTTLLHEFASNKNKNITYSLKNLFKNITIIETKVTSVGEDILYTDKGDISYDYLIFGIGSEKNTFGISGLEDKLDIGNINNAKLVSEKIKENFKSEKDIDRNVIICGAGLTGVEFAGALSEYAKVNNIKASIVLVEAAERILPPFTKEQAEYAKDILTKNGIVVYEKAKITQGSQNNILIEKDGKTQELVASNIVWTAGVKGNHITSKSPFKCQNDRALIDEYCRPKDYNKSNIFVIGDCSMMIDKSTNRPYPPTAQFAQKQGEYIAEILEDILEGRENIKPFVYKSKGTACSLCNKKAVGDVGGKALFGLKAYFLKKIIDRKWLYKLYGIKSFFM